MRRALAFVGAVYFFTQMLAILLPPAIYLPLAVAFALIFAIVFAAVHKSKKYTHALVLLSVISVALFLRCGYYTFTVNPLKNLEGETHIIEGTVRQVNPLYTDNVRAKIYISSMDGVKLKKPFYTQISGLYDITAGDKLTAEVKFRQNENSENKLMLYAKNIFITAQPTKPPVTHGEAKDIIAAFSRVQNKLSNNITSVMHDETGNIAAAMSVGDKTKLSTETKYLFRCAGISHLLVVSGMHLAAIGGMVYFCGRKIFSSRKIGAGMGIIATVTFMLLTGLTPSVIRAGTALLIVYLGILLSKVPDTVTSIGLAALILTIQNPFAVIDLGLLLSFTATLGVLAASYITLQFGKLTFALKHRLIFKLFCAIAVSLGASIFTLPIIIGFGGAISVLSVGFNLLAVPLLPFIAASTLGVACLANFAVAAPIVFLLKSISSVLIAFIMWLTQLAAELPYNLVYISGGSAFVFVILLYLLIYAAYHYKIRCAPICIAVFMLVGLSTELYLAKDIVSVEPMYIRGTPAAAIMQNGKAVIIFSASASGAKVLQKTLQEHNISHADTVIDYRRSEHDMDICAELGADNYYNIEQNVTNNKTIDVLKDVKIYIKRQKEGITACIDIGGYKIELANGCVDYQNYGAVDLCIAGENEPTNLKAKEYFSPNKTPEWLRKLDEDVIVPQEVYRIDIRANKSVRMCENFYGYE